MKKDSNNPVTHTRNATYTSTGYNYTGNLSFRAGHILLSDTEWYELKCLTFSPTACITTSNPNSLPSSLIKEAIILSKFSVLSLIRILLTLRNFQLEKDFKKTQKCT